MTITLPAQNIKIDLPTGVDPIWYDKLKSLIGLVNGGTIGQGALTTTATSGFGYMPTCAGAPTGVPSAKAGFVPFVFDTTNNKLWVYNGAWKGVVLT